VLLSSCSTSGGVEELFDAGPAYTAENPGFGITGEALPDFNYFGGAQLADADVAMSVACQNLDGFETGTVISNGADLTPEPQVLKTNFRTFAVTTLDIYQDDYPELEIYYKGAIEKLADPSSNPEGYRSFLAFCEPYIALAKRTDEIWTEPVTLEQDYCWSGKDIRHTLQVRLNGSWFDVGGGVSKKNSACSDKEYPWLVTESFVTYDRSWQLRWVSRPSPEFDSFADDSKRIILTFDVDPFGTATNFEETRE
jgi:hypothetical protein